eukprot:TRINITY_DN14459_c0_g1_i1.p1 TRINITY_DN14459_c0_g1~~TRINITY_DN14459_c0_g1_i1.p1  ORF type:complete len:375 (+),score=67.11 TRINITY_DN14459_c0_g1_i1:115-1239(+)
MASEDKLEEEAGEEIEAEAEAEAEAEPDADAAEAEEDSEQLKKKGKELFRELLRVYPVAEPEDYFRAGLWLDDLMRTDIQLIEAHRKEAGAPEPCALDEVEMPQLPTATGFFRPGLGLSRSAPTLSVTGAAASAAGPIAELRLIALFVAKWKLDPTRTKMLLAKVAPPRRKYIIEKFSPPAGQDTATVTAALETFVARCEKTGEWGPAIAAAGPSVSPLGVKRSISAVTGPAVSPLLSRPRITPLATTSPASAIAAAKLAATRAAAAARLGVAASPRPASISPAPYRPVAASPLARIATGTLRPLGVTAARPMGVRPVAARPLLATTRPMLARPAVGALRPGGAVGWGSGAVRPLASPRPGGIRPITPLRPAFR